jgi:hypothetical protein
MRSRGGHLRPRPSASNPHFIFRFGPERLHSAAAGIPRLNSILHALSRAVAAGCAGGGDLGFNSENEMILLYRDYRLQANRKTREGTNHPDRDGQFRYINDQVKAAFAAGQPAISVDTKKKELVGDFKNGGREWRPKGSPEQVRVHDFVIPELGRAVPYGVYDIADNVG